MPSHVYPAELYFKHIFSRYLIETLAQFSKELQPLLSGEGKAGEAELGPALRALSTAEIVPFCARNLSKSQFCTMERFHHENGEQRLETHRQE